MIRHLSYSLIDDMCNDTCIGRKISIHYSHYILHAHSYFNLGVVCYGELIDMLRYVSRIPCLKITILPSISMSVTTISLLILHFERLLQVSILHIGSMMYIHHLPWCLGQQLSRTFNKLPDIIYTLAVRSRRHHLAEKGIAPSSITALSRKVLTASSKLDEIE